MAARKKPLPKKQRLVFARWITNRKTGARIYPRSGKAFAFYVDA